jgi:hypothetical protein
VLALRGETTRVLPAAVRDLVPLQDAIEAGVRLVLGKQVDPQAYPARVARLGATGAEIESNAPLAVFGALQLLLAMEPALAVDGKVVELTERDGVAHALARFTGVDWENQARIEAYAREQSRHGYDAGSKP